MTLFHKKHDISSGFKLRQIHFCKSCYSCWININLLMSVNISDYSGQDIQVSVLN